MTTTTAERPSIWVELLGSSTRYYDAGGIRTRSIEAGSGMPLIMLHGVGGHAETWTRNVLPLSAHFDVRAIDYYGHGLTGYGTLPYSKEAYVKHLIAFMDAAGIEKAHLVGESLGGWIATWVAIEHPERVAKVVYVVGAHLKVPIDEETEKITEAGIKELARLSRQFNEHPTRENVHARLKWLFVKPDRDIDDELIDLRWALYQKRIGQPNPAMAIGADGPSQLTPENLAKIPVPVLFLWTDHNPSQQIATAKKAMTYVHDAEWALIEDAGHWPQWEQTDAFNRIVTDYLSR